MRNRHSPVKLGEDHFTSIDADASGDHAVTTLTATPAPATLSLLALGGMALFRRTRRKAIPSRVEMWDGAAPSSRKAFTSFRGSVG